MEGILKYLRLRTATLAAAFVAAAAVLGAMSASANAVCVFGFCPKDVSVEFINNSEFPLFVQICPRGHSKDPGDSQSDPCRVITYSSVIGRGGKRETYGPFDSMGLIVTPSSTAAVNRRLYFYVENPLIGPPFMRVQGIGITLTENQEVGGVVDKLAWVGLQRFSDADVNGNSVKVMKIVIRQWARQR